MTDLIDTTEMYLRTIFELLEDGVPPLRARIAEQLGHAGPTVSQTIARMERDGLVVVEGDRTLRLTDEGLTRATRVMRKHRLAEVLLTEVIGLTLADAHEEACRWEHVMSERVERRLVEMLDHPRRSPYGNAIPGLSELCDIHKTGTDVPEGVVSMADFVENGGTEGTLFRIGEAPQSLEGFLEDAAAIDLLPGTMVRLAEVPDGIEVGTSRGTLVIGGDVARHLFVGTDSQLGP
ncbi:MAG: metal-dependent transcriptional regulator [Demequinaceae bacterium]|nr:metal-dependent transcriptional regulator [Demequinaceae bacterium]